MILLVLPPRVRGAREWRCDIYIYKIRSLNDLSTTLLLHLLDDLSR